MASARGHVERTRQALGRLGFELADSATVAEARDVAARHVPGPLAPVDILWAAQARSGCTAFALRDAGGALSALISVLPLTRDAAPALREGRFDGLAPPMWMIARPQDTPAAIYIWGAAGLSWRGRVQALAASVTLQRDVYPHLACYARGATSDGERVLQGRMGARPLPGPAGLVCAAPWRPQIQAA